MLPATHAKSKTRQSVNDIHSGLNATRVRDILSPGSVSELSAIIADAAKRKHSITICGSRHAMGGQQFATDALLIDMRKLNRVIELNDRGIIEVEAGITWPEILAHLEATRGTHDGCPGTDGWAIAQKQTGADHLTLGGALAANVHGRSLDKGPMIEDIESFTLLDPEGRQVECSRERNADLFRTAIGGYGLFGPIVTIRLRLVPRLRMERVVRIAETGNLIQRFDERTASGFTFGDFQFQIDDQADDFLQRGIFSCYRKTDHPKEGIKSAKLTEHDWMELLHLAHADKSRGFARYRDHYLRTDGSHHWSDEMQFTPYVDGYHKKIDERLGSACSGSEMITELYVPRERLAEFLAKAADSLRRKRASVIYGTVRMIEADRESFLRWAREPWACVVFNLCVRHSPEGLRDARSCFRQLINIALSFQGTYYLTYHRFARPDQVETAYPMMREFLKRKREWDPRERFQSDWYRHHRDMLLKARSFAGT